jgi:hypothetical protein
LFCPGAVDLPAAAFACPGPASAADEIVIKPNVTPAATNANVLI